MSETKKCPACAEEIKIEAKKCRYCGEDFEENINKEIFNNYKKWLSKNYPSETVIGEDYKNLTLSLTRKYKSFNLFIFLILLLLWILPGILYLILTLQEKTINTTITFNKKGEVINVSNGYKYLMNHYNQGDKYKKHSSFSLSN